MSRITGYAYANIENGADEYEAAKEVACWFHVLPFITKAQPEPMVDPEVDEDGNVREVLVYFEGRSEMTTGDLADIIEHELSWKGATFGDVSVVTLDVGGA